MADTNKAEKLAAARKKLKEFQQRNRQSPVAAPKDRVDVSTPASVTSQTSSIDLKAAGTLQHEAICLDEQPSISYEYNPQAQSLDYSNQYYSADFSHEQPPGSTPYYYNGAANSIPENVMVDNHRRYSTNSNGGPSADNSSLIIQLAERDNTIASLQYQLQSLSVATNSKDVEVQNAVREAEVKWFQKVAELEGQLKTHAQTVNILVAEKSEYQASLAKANELLKLKADEWEETQQQLRSFQQKLNESESALASIRDENSSKGLEISDKQKRYDELATELRRVEGERDEHKHQNNQLQQRINVTIQQVAMLQAELQEKQSQLTSTQVRLKQLGGSLKDSDDTSIVDELKAERERSASLEKIIAGMKSDLAEKEQASQQYQQFVHQLNQQLSNLATKVQDSTRENEKLKEQNTQMVEHVSSLETRLNKLNQFNSHTPQPVDNQELVKLKEELRTALEEKYALKQKLDSQEIERSSYEESILRYQETIRRLEEERPDERKLLAAMESDRVAAQRATAQNSKLKDQLLEMEQVKAQMIEQMHTLEARARQAQSLQECLIDAQNEIKNLNNRLNQKPEDPQVNGNTSEIEESLSPEATKKLEIRFTELMRKLADTADEKQKLEHLVMQLQGETETIGEYVALYQQQRCLLRERAAEKDREIARMGDDRAELVQELKKVGHLVLQLVNDQRDNNSGMYIVFWYSILEENEAI
ncbi:Hypothetical predicted protein [Cloeon dipterum]|uniref:Golgin subfamily A conserved domain-containing protein n=1 Tax=Cloeon dipterum TaxID=197152 RepID=A0A8S1D3C5_9INSE|nr:Hypothetical predicted protein [Cloeon dipterum]